MTKPKPSSLLAVALVGVGFSLLSAAPGTATAAPAPTTSPSTPRTGPTAAPRGSATPAPQCVVSLTPAQAGGPTCSSVKSVGALDAGKWTTSTTVEFVGGAAGQFSFVGLPTASMHTGAEAGFAYDVTLTQGAQKWAAKRAANDAAPATVMLRFTTSTPTGSTPTSQSFVSHGYAIVPLLPVTATGATLPVQLRVDF